MTTPVNFRSGRSVATLSALAITLAACSPPMPTTLVPTDMMMSPTNAWQGAYSGYGIYTSGNPMACSREVAVSGLRVTGNTVTFGSLTGPIKTESAVSVADSTDKLTGSFQAGWFSGTWSKPAVPCNYAIVTTRSAP